MPYSRSGGTSIGNDTGVPAFVTKRTRGSALSGIAAVEATGSTVGFAEDAGAVAVVAGAAAPVPVAPVDAGAPEDGAAGRLDAVHPASSTPAQAMTVTMIRATTRWSQASAAVASGGRPTTR